MQEGGANATEGEVVYALKGKAPTTPNLDAYYVGNDGQALSDRTYSKRVNRVRELGCGSATSSASAKAIKILKEMGVYTA